MNIRKGVNGGLFVVFADNYAAEKWEWLFWSIMRRPTACFGQYENAYRII